MTKHQKTEAFKSLSRRNFLIGTGATGLLLGYAAFPEIGEAFGAGGNAANLEPAVWYSIDKDGKVTVTCGKAEMGQHISSTMAQIVAEELKAIVLKTTDQYVLVGRSVQQLDIPAKTNGTAKYGIDAFVPGMVYGKLALPPVRFGAVVKSVDDSAAKKVPGFIKAVVVDDKTGTTSGGVVAVASSYEGAKAAAEALKIDWDKGPYASVSDQSILEESRRLQKDE